MARFEVVDGTSSKFWEVEVVGSTVKVRWGRIGTEGQSKDHAHRSAAEASEHALKLTAEKVKKGYVAAKAGRASSTAGKKPAPATAKSAASAQDERIEALVALGELLAGSKAAGLGVELRLAVADPKAYLKKFARRLDERGIEEPDDVMGTSLAWIALTDGLAARKRVAEVDWREAGEDVLHNLKQIAGDVISARKLSWEGEIEELKTQEVLDDAAHRLRAEGVVLATIDIASDCYPLVLYRLADHERVQALAARCKAAKWGKMEWPGKSDAGAKQNAKPAKKR
jgi:predicted DNA-binding WGR domain protein